MIIKPLRGDPSPWERPARIDRTILALAALFILALALALAL